MNDGTYTIYPDTQFNIRNGNEVWTHRGAGSQRIGFITETPKPPIPHPVDGVLRCEECDGTKVHVAAWVDANTNERLDDAELDPWCEDCEEHVALITTKKGAHHD